MFSPHAAPMPAQAHQPMAPPAPTGGVASMLKQRATQGMGGQRHAPPQMQMAGAPMQLGRGGTAPSMAGHMPMMAL